MALLITSSTAYHCAHLQRHGGLRFCRCVHPHKLYDEAEQPGVTGARRTVV